MSVLEGRLSLGRPSVLGQAIRKACIWRLLTDLLDDCMRHKEAERESHLRDGYAQWTHP
jgi:hypothetical protein